MQKEAIEAIAELVSASENNLNVAASDIEGAIFAPSSFKLHDLEGMLPAPRQMRGTYSTSSIDDYCQYIDDNQDASTPAQVFIDADKRPLQATAYFDLGHPGSPGHGLHQTKLTLVDSPELAAVLEATQQSLSQRDLADFIEDWADMLTCEAGGETLRLAAVLHAVRNVSIKASSSATMSESNFGASRSAMDEIEASSAVERLPESIFATFVPHNGLDPIKVEMRVGLRTGDEKPKFVLRWVAQQAHLKAIADDLRVRIAGNLEATSAIIYQGTFNR